MTEEDIEKYASGEGEQECWFGEKGCHELRLLPKWGKSGHPHLRG